jgi:hypothetical protein
MIVAATGTVLATDVYMNGKKKIGHLISQLTNITNNQLNRNQYFHFKKNQYLPSSFHVERTIHFPLSAEICTVKNKAMLWLCVLAIMQQRMNTKNITRKLIPVSQEALCYYATAEI